ncbi:MAG: zinc-binding dehydrogenase [Planctomycetota bacterium]
MKAAVINRFGGSDVFEYGEVPASGVQPGQVVIKVLACGINRYDTYLRMGAIIQDIAFPHVMGADIAGEIHEVGTGVTGWKPGRRVVVAPGFPVDSADWGVQPENLAPSYTVTGTKLWGGYAQYVRAPARFVLADEGGLPAEEMACLPLVLVTAVHAVRTLGQAGDGTAVLVQAGASGSGNMCIQVAKALGARVAATVGAAEKVETAAHAGADLVVNYSRENFADRILEWTAGRGVDLVIDNVGGSVFTDNLRCLRKGGTFVNFGAVGGIHGKVNFLELLFRQLTIRGSMMGSMEELRFGLTLLRQGRIRPVLDRAFPLANVKDAHDYMEQRKVRGKIVLLPWAQ